MKKILFIIFSFSLIFNIANAQTPDFTEEQWKSFFTEHVHQLDRLEGIWSVGLAYKATIRGKQPMTGGQQDILKYAIKKTSSSTYTVYHIKGNNATVNGTSVKSNVIKCSFEQTANENEYLFEQIDKIQKRDGTSANYKFNSTALLKANSNLEYSFEYSNAINDDINSKQLYESFIITERLIKIMPDVESNNEMSKQGTGFAISSNGFIATNNHVVSGATTITVRGINGDFSKRYNANLIIADKKNDLAIIQVIGLPDSKNLGHIPFNILNRTSDVGSSVFVLGYPKDAVMGDEIKLTNGIISSKTGVQGDVTTYQISAPMQPGNSGGPLFDNRANVIGITNAKLIGGENVNYAIKSNYLLDLIQSLPNPVNLQSTNTLTNKSLVEQVKALKNFIYIIEVK